MENASIALENLLGTYNQRIRSQLDAEVCDFNALSRNVLKTIQMHHEPVFDDFVRRQKTGAIPADPANFYACLAGSIIMCDSAQIINESARQIKAELVSSSSNRILEGFVVVGESRLTDRISVNFSFFCEPYMNVLLRT